MYLHFFIVGDKLQIRTKGVGQGKVDRKEKQETLDAKISIGNNRLNKEILVSTSRLGRSLDALLNCKKSKLFCRICMTE